MDMSNIKSCFILSAFAIIAQAAGLGAQEVPFETLHKNISLIKILPAAAPEVSGAGKAADGTAAKAAPELAYEKLLAAPLWRPAAGVTAGVELKEGFSPAKHQGNRNVCNAFAALGLAEYLVWEKEGIKADFSEEFLYYNAKLNFTDKPELQAYKREQGLAGYVAVGALSAGVVAEKEWPFLSVLPPHTPVPPLTDPDLGVPPPGVAGKVLKYRFTPLAVRRGEIKNFLSKERKPVVMNLMFYFGNVDNASGRVKDPDESQRARCFSAGDNCGGHVVLLTGYDQAAGEYIFRNSWGAGWGASGFGRLSEKYVMENCESCHYLGQLGSSGQGSRTMIVNAAYGWSAGLK